MKLSQIQVYWDCYLKDWDASPYVKALTEKSSGRYFHKSSLLNAGVNYLPEPYYGDAKSPYCVIINLNPGLSHSLDWVKLHNGGGFLYNSFNATNYSSFNQSFSPFLLSSIASIGTPLEIPGAKWWKDNRMEWINSFLHRLKGIHSLFPFIGQPLALEICPWHSKRWDNSIIEGMDRFIIDSVIEPAAEAIKPNHFGFCFGKTIGDLLIKYGFAVVKQWDAITPTGVWPLNKKGGRVNRTYRLLKMILDNRDVYFLNLYAKGTFKSPSKDFMLMVEPDIIKELQMMGFK